LDDEEIGKEYLQWSGLTAGPEQKEREAVKMRDKTGVREHYGRLLRGKNIKQKGKSRAGKNPKGKSELAGKWVNRRGSA